MIAGCDTGFGNILAKYLDKKGFKVFAGCLDTRCDGAIDLKENCSSKLTVIGLDVTDVASVQQALSTVKENLNGSGRLAIQVFYIFKMECIIFFNIWYITQYQ